MFTDKREPEPTVADTGTMDGSEVLTIVIDGEKKTMTFLELKAFLDGLVVV